MKKNKGFTLIELLAVIVILAIIAIIAVPIILNVVEKSKESSAVDSAYGYINAIENNLATAEVKSGLVAEDKEYDDLSTFEETYNITVKGTKPSSGTFTLEKRKVVSAEFIINGYNVICNKRKCESRGKNIKVLITYNANGGTLDKTDDRVVKNSTINLPIPTKNDYSFVGWYTEENGEEEITNETPITSELTLYARYVKTINNFEYTGNVQEITLPKGRYKLEVWGAQGGNYSSYQGGKGGYSYGIIELQSSTNLFIYNGGQSTGNGEGFNGGGSSRNSSYTTTSTDSEGNQTSHTGSTQNRGGGGGTDIRIGIDSLYSRVIVAGGGSGANSGGAGNYGGGTQGGGSYPGTQVSAGSGGSFGVGANNTTTNYKYTPAGGGGGWYGGGIGGVSDSSSSYRRYHSGGSAWVYTEASYNTWKSANQTDADKYELTSEYYLTDAETIAGNQTFKAPNGNDETGHSGNGYARITYLGK